MLLLLNVRRENKAVIFRRGCVSDIRLRDA
jgi:hypothetical protein